MREPYLIYLKHEDGLNDCVETQYTEHEATLAVEKMIAEIRASNDTDYAGCYYQIFQYQSDGVSDWEEPIAKFPIFE